MKAIILAAGYATRLYPLTLNKPKALLPIAGKPILDYIVKKINEIEDINEIFIITNNKFYMNFIWWLNQYKSSFKEKIEIINDGTISDETKLGGIGDLWLVIKEKNIQDDVLVVNGDNLFDFSIRELINFFNGEKKIVNGIYELENKEEKRFGVVELKDGKIIDFEEKPQEPKTNLISIGIYLFPKSELKKIEEYMKTGGPKDAPGYLIQHLYKIQPVYGFVFKGRYFDIGVLEDYKKANEIW